MNVTSIKKTPRQHKKKIAVGTLRAFDPISSVNTIEIWDGDIDLNNIRWVGSKNSNTIDFFNSPDVSGTLNGHSTVLFDGINQYGNCVSPVLPSPNTIYFVLRQITYTSTKYIFDDGVNANIVELYQETTSPFIRYRTTLAQLLKNELAINKWGIVTSYSNGFQGGIRYYLNTMNFLLSGAELRKGLTLANKLPLLTSFGNIEFAYIIMRDVADSTAVQNNFINWLKNRFAI